MSDLCKHCGKPTKNNGHTHVHTNLMRCLPEDSGLPYGYNAEPEGESCTSICLGSADGKEEVK